MGPAGTSTATATAREGASGDRAVLLDGMRGISAIGVMLHHVLFPGFSLGMLYVDLFFVLSGFVLARAYEGRMRAGLTTGAFLELRVRRLWPVIASGAVIGAVSALSYDPALVVLALLLWHLTLMPVPFAGSELYPLNVAHWSIACELVANLAHALVLRRLGLRGLAAWIAVSGGVNAALALGLLTLPSALVPLHVLPRVAFAYAIGVAFARVGAGALRVPQLPAWVVALLPTAAIVAMGATRLAPEPAGLLFVVTLAPVLFALHLAAPRPGPRLAAACERLGALSFPLYAVHFPICRSLRMLDKGWAMTGFAMILSVAVALLVSRLFDPTQSRGSARPALRRPPRTRSPSRA